VDEAWMDAQIAQFDTLMAQRGAFTYSPPVLSEHIKDGKRLGDLFVMSKFTDQGDGRKKLAVLARYADDVGEDLDKAIKARRVRYASPSFGDIEDSTGQSYNFALTEVSIVSSPHLKNLAARHVFAEYNGVPMPDPNQPPTPAPDGTAPAEERIKALEGEVGGIKAMVTANSATLSDIKTMLSPDPEPEPEPAPTPAPTPNTPAPALSASEQRLKDLETKLASETARAREASFAASYQQIRGLNLTVDGKELGQALFQFSEKCPKEFGVFLATLSKPAPVPVPTPEPKPEAPAFGAGDPWASFPMGPGPSFAEVNAPSGGDKIEAAAKRAKAEAGGDKAKEIELFQKYST
ncbi:MAG: hypothetical protein ACPG77_06530, partial [Nannocystaceae bacterium]